jgi:hypothetical protein
MKYLIEPSELSYSQIKSKLMLSGLIYNTLIHKNKNQILVKDLIKEPVKGIEVGENAYVEKSDYYFIKNRSMYVSYLSFPSSILAISSIFRNSFFTILLYASIFPCNCG